MSAGRPLQSHAGLDKFDAVILGGGPAGTAIALMLSQHAPELSVAIVESSDFTQLRIGETLPPQVQSLLRKLGVWDTFIDQAHCEALGASSSWESGETVENPFILSPHKRGWHLDRRRFDQMLCEQAAHQGVRVFTATKLIAHHPEGSGTRLVLQGAERFEIQGAFVADATGRRASYALRQGAKRIRFDRLVGAIRFFDCQEGASIDSFTHIEPWQHGWWYSALIPDGKMVIACMTDADLCQQLTLNEQDIWLAKLMETTESRLRAEQARPSGSITVRPAQSQRLTKLHGDRWLAAGDAATTYDPLSGQGVMKALRFGIFAAYAISDRLQGRRSALKKYEHWVTADFESYLETRTTFYQQEQRWRDSKFWQRRHSKSPLADAS